MSGKDINTAIRKAEAQMIYRLLWDAIVVEKQQSLTTAELLSRMDEPMGKGRFGEVIQVLVNSKFVVQSMNARRRATYTINRVAIDHGLHEFKGILPTEQKGLRIIKGVVA